MDRLAYWARGSARQAQDNLAIGNRTFLKSWLLDDEDYVGIRRAVQRILSLSLAGDVQSLGTAVRAINQTTTLRVKKHLDLHTQLESHVIRVLSALGCLDGVEGIEFPMNVRAMHGVAPEGYLDFEHCPDRLHSDIWSGEPGDTLNCFLYIDGDVAHTFLEIFDPLPSSADSIAGYEGPYEGATGLTDGATRVDYEPRKGQFLIFDSICPHRTMRTGGGARISIDFRLRRLDPYGAIDARWDRPRQPWAKYWYLPQACHDSFHSRCAEELRRLDDGRDLARGRARRDWIAKLQAAQE